MTLIISNLDKNLDKNLKKLIKNKLVKIKKSKTNKKNKTPKTKAPSSDDLLFFYLKVKDKDLLKLLVREHKFSESKHCFDFANLDTKIAIECDGGRWAAGGGRHASCEDYVKLNKALLLGWKVLRFTMNQIKKNPVHVVETIRSLYEIEKNKV